VIYDLHLLLLSKDLRNGNGKMDDLGQGAYFHYISCYCLIRISLDSQIGLALSYFQLYVLASFI